MPRRRSLDGGVTRSGTSGYREFRSGALARRGARPACPTSADRCRGRCTGSRWCRAEGNSRLFAVVCPGHRARRSTPRVRLQLGPFGAVRDLRRRPMSGSLAPHGPVGGDRARSRAVAQSHVGTGRRSSPTESRAAPSRSFDWRIDRRSRGTRTGLPGSREATSFLASEWRRLLVTLEANPFWGSESLGRPPIGHVEPSPIREPGKAPMSDGGAHQPQMRRQPRKSRNGLVGR